MGQRRKLLEMRELTDIDLFHRMVVIEEWRQIMRNDPAPEPQLVRSLATLSVLENDCPFPVAFRLLVGYINCRDARRQSEVSKAEDPKDQTDEHHRPE